MGERYPAANTEHHQPSSGRERGTQYRDDQQNRASDETEQSDHEKDFGDRFPPIRPHPRCGVVSQCNRSQHDGGQVCLEREADETRTTFRDRGNDVVVGC